MKNKEEGEKEIQVEKEDCIGDKVGEGAVCGAYWDTWRKEEGVCGTEKSLSKTEIFL